MFNRTQKNTDADKLEIVMDRILSEMETYGPDSPEYPALMQRLKEIVELRASKEKRSIDPNNALLVGGNLLGILVIVAYEHSHALTSKAVNFVLKSK